jgi:hypothetical protein
MQCSALKAVQWVQCSAGRRAPEGIKGPCRHQHTAFQHQRLQCLQCSVPTPTWTDCPAVAPNALQCGAVQWWCSVTRHSGSAVGRLVRAVQGVDSMHSTPYAPLYCGSAVHCTVMHALQWVQCSAGRRAPEGIKGPCRHKHTAFQHQRRQCQAVPEVPAVQVLVLVVVQCAVCAVPTGKRPAEESTTLHCHALHTPCSDWICTTAMGALQTAGALHCVAVAVQYSACIWQFFTVQ